jgi:hypothetical protein
MADTAAALFPPTTYHAMARTRQTAKKSTGAPAPHKVIVEAPPGLNLNGQDGTVVRGMLDLLGPIFRLTFIGVRNQTAGKHPYNPCTTIATDPWISGNTPGKSRWSALFQYLFN